MPYLRKRFLNIYRKYASVPKGLMPMYLHIFTNRGLQIKKTQLKITIRPNSERKKHIEVKQS